MEHVGRDASMRINTPVSKIGNHILRPGPQNTAVNVLPWLFGLVAVVAVIARLHGTRNS